MRLTMEGSLRELDQMKKLLEPLGIQFEPSHSKWEGGSKTGQNSWTEAARSYEFSPSKLARVEVLV